MEDVGNLAKRPFEDNEESEEKVDHYHAHGKNCEDMGHHLEKGEHELPHEVQGNEDEKDEHSEPAEIEGKEDEKDEHGYPGMIRKVH